MLDEIYNKLVHLPKDYLKVIVLQLMKDNKISFSELADLHVQYIDDLRKGETDELMKLRAKIVCLWCDTKKNLGKNLVALMQEGKDNGWVNIDQEKIDNSKWKK